MVGDPLGPTKDDPLPRSFVAGGADTAAEAPGDLPSGRFLRAVRRQMLLGASLTAGLAMGPRSRDRFAILLYHRVTDSPGQPTMNVSPNRFRQQLQGLQAAGFRAWPLSRLLDRHRRAQPIPPRVFAVTFDDGYGCVCEEALPILRSLNVPATVFLSTAYVDQAEPMSFDNWPLRGSPETRPGAWRPLTTAQCAQLLESGVMELGSHTHTHRDFRGQAAEMQQDVARSTDLLRDRWGIERPAFAFPYGVKRLGFCSDELIEAVRRAGTSCGLSTLATLNNVHRSPFSWGRIEVTDNDSAHALLTKLNGWYSWLHLAWHGLRGGGFARNGKADAS